MTCGKRRGAAWVVALATWFGGAAASTLAPTAALAQGAGPELRVTASATTVEVDEPFSVELVALAERGDPVASDPQIKVPKGLSIVGRSMSSQTYAQLGGGRPTVKTGFSMRWDLQASAPGRYVIPAPSVEWNGKRLAARPIDIEVVPATGRPRAQRQLPDPFGIIGGRSQPTLPWPFGRDEIDELLEDGPTAPELDLARASDAAVFLRAVADKTAVVVGEQVTLSFYQYKTPSAVFERDEVHTAPLAGFVRVPMLRNPAVDPPVRANVGGQRWIAALLDRVALFPVRAGELHTGSMTARYTGRRIGKRALRESNDIVVQVTEPPKAGRPPGYVLGDVGQFQLSATVQPRRVDQGGSVAVTVKVAGRGNLPQSLRVPARTGVEWLDPEKREQIEPQAGVVAGFRSFGYVVRLLDAGPIDLGMVELPFWDPVDRRYAVARAELGKVEVNAVAGGAGPAAGAASSANAPGGGAEPEAPTGIAGTLPKARRTLAAFERPGPGPLEGSRFWWLLSAPPLAVALGTAASRGVRLARKLRASAGTKSAALAEKALADAYAAETKGDAKGVAAAIERALHHAIDGSTGLKSRGLLRDELPAALEARAVPAEVARRAADLVATCERLRFDPLAGAEDRSSLYTEAEAVVRLLSRSR